MKLLTICLTLCLIFNFLLFAQENKPETKRKVFKTSFLIDVNIINETKVYHRYQPSKDTINVYPLNMYFSGQVYFINNLCMEFRAGFILGGEYYSGVEYGFYLRYYLKNFYIISGVNFHDNFGEGHNMVSVTSGTVILANISFGYKLNKSFGAFVSYYHPLEFYNIYNVDDITTHPPMVYDVNLVNIFRLGIEYTF